MKHVDKPQYAWSVDGYKWNNGLFNSRKKAISDALENAEDSDCTPSDHVFIGKCKSYPNSYFFPDADYIIEQMACAADDVGGDYASDYPDVTDEAVSELTTKLHELLESWCKEHKVEPTFYSIESSELIKIR